MSGQVFKISFLKLRFFACILLCIFSLVVVAQPEEDEVSDKITVKPAPFSLRMDLGVPTPMNSAWRKCMVGIFEGNIAMDMKLFSGFFAGVGYKGSLLYTPPKFFVFELKTKMQMHNAYVQVGYDIYRSNNFFVTPSINSGMCFTRYTNVQCKKAPLSYKPEYTTWFIEPKCTFNFTTERKMGLSVHVSYGIVNHVWDPTFICMQDWISLAGTNQQGITSYINIGMGVYIGMGHGRKIAGK